MRFLNDHYTGYEELKTFYPLFYQEVYEMDEVLKAEGKLIDGIRTGAERIFSNRFIMTADSETIADYENIMGIVTDHDKPIEERRLLIKALLAGSGRLSASQIKTIVKNCTGRESDIKLEKQDPDDDYDTLMIKAMCGGDDDLYLDSLNTILRDKLPSHIDYHIDFDYSHTIELVSEIYFYITLLPQCNQYQTGQRIPF